MRIWQVDDNWEKNVNGEWVKNYIVQRKPESELNVLRLYTNGEEYAFYNMVTFYGDVEECEKLYKEINPNDIAQDINKTFRLNWGERELIIEGYDLYQKIGETI